MKNKYLVFYPLTEIPALRCNTIEEAETFIVEHVEKNKENYKLIGGGTLKKDLYLIRDLSTIMTFEEYQKYQEEKV